MQHDDMMLKASAVPLYDGRSGRRVLEGISPRAWEHPADRAALAAVRKVPVLDAMLRKLIGLIGERSIRYFYLANAVRVDERQFSRLHELLGECLEVLDIAERPELYVTQTPLVNAGAVGVERPFIVLNTGTIDLLDDDELRYVLGHELAHIQSDHALYKTLLALLLQIPVGRLGIPFGGIAIFGLIAALREWDRKSELSADRGGLLVAQDPAIAYRVNMKLAGGHHAAEMNLDAFLEQAEAYETGGDALDGVAKLANLLGERHPFHVMRVAEIRRWVASGEFGAILDGGYRRRSEEDAARLYDEVKDGARSYQEAYRSARDPLARFFQDVGNSASSAASTAVGKARDLWRRAGGTDD